MNIRRLGGLLCGRVVGDVEANPERLAIHFADGSVLVITPTVRGMSVVLEEVGAPAPANSRDRPTSRQRDYLDFIRRYMTRHGMSPAESDIQDHFMVSAPSAHQMVKTLERRGFITRDRDIFGGIVPRSIRVVVD